MILKTLRIMSRLRPEFPEGPKMAAFFKTASVSPKILLVRLQVSFSRGKFAQFVVIFISEGPHKKELK